MFFIMVGSLLGKVGCKSSKYDGCMKLSLVCCLFIDLALLGDKAALYREQNIEHDPPSRSKYNLGPRRASSLLWLQNWGYPSAHAPGMLWRCPSGIFPAAKESRLKQHLPQSCFVLFCLIAVK